MIVVKIIVRRAIVVSLNQSYLLMQFVLLWYNEALSSISMQSRCDFFPFQSATYNEVDLQLKRPIRHSFRHIYARLVTILIATRLVFSQPPTSTPYNSTIQQHHLHHHRACAFVSLDIPQDQLTTHHSPIGTRRKKNVRISNRITFNHRLQICSPRSLRRHLQMVTTTTQAMKLSRIRRTTKVIERHNLSNSIAVMKVV